ncbi:MAG: hypothetical protein AAFO04_22305 [Cyanobacteria bacterium J06592_8]
MNASEQANSIEVLSKIATIVNLFTSEFPDASVEFSPWVKNAETAKFEDPNSIDLAFYFQRRNFSCQSCCILMQIRLPEATEANSRPVGIELSGHDYMGQRWRFDTNRKWEFWGTILPLPNAEQKLKQVCMIILQLFDLVKKGNSAE